MLDLALLGRGSLCCEGKGALKGLLEEASVKYGPKEKSTRLKPGSPGCLTLWHG